MEINSNGFEPYNSGFAYLNDKANALLPIVGDYNVRDLATAIFAIASWRDNRSAQESCLALNLALCNCPSFGYESIKTYEDFISFFQFIEPILKTTHLDDMVVNDFGEIRICFDNRFFPVITGTGHSGSVYGALQYLEGLSQELGQDIETRDILEYEKRRILSLKTFNVSKYDDVEIAFDLPSREYFSAVQNYMEDSPSFKLDRKTVALLSNPSKSITKRHFLLKDNETFLLFNPSFVLDYYISLLEHASPQNIKDHIHSVLYRKLELLHFNEEEMTTCALMRYASIAIDEKLSTLREITILCARGNTVILLVDVDGMEDAKVQEYTNMLRSLHTENRLGFVDLSHAVGVKQFFGIKVPNNQTLDIILFSRHTNLDETYIQFGGREDQITLSAIDLVYLLLMSDDIAEISEFLKFHTQTQARVLSFGGISDFFALWKQENGYISKGAVEYDLINPAFELAATYTVELYTQWEMCFPFHLLGMPMGLPEQWRASPDENGVYKFTRKGMKRQGGAGFLLKDGGFIFFSYDFNGIIQNQHTQNIRSWFDLVSGLNERFLLQYQTLLGEVTCLQNVFVNLELNSLTAGSKDNVYVEVNFKEISPNNIYLQYSVNCQKLMKDISDKLNRAVESTYLLELLYPLLHKYPSELHLLKESIEKDATKDKTVDVVLKEINYYLNLDILPLRLTDAALIAARKIFAKVAADSGVEPGEYTGREATKIARMMQGSLISYFESQISSFDRLGLHSSLLHYYSSELFGNYTNYSGYVLTDNIDKAFQQNSKEKLISLREKNKQMQATLQYIIETNLFLTTNRGNKTPRTSDIEELAAFSHWLGVFQSNSDMCFHTSADTRFIVMDDYRVDVEFGEAFHMRLDEVNKRTYESEIYRVRRDKIDKVFFDKLAEGFQLDTGVDFRVLESVLKQLMECSFPKEKVEYEEIRPNVIRLHKASAIQDYLSFVTVDVPILMVQKTYDFLTLSSEKLKTIDGNQHPILPVWERQKRNERFDVKPLLSVGDSYIYSPIVTKELHDRWVHGWTQFYPPYEIGLDNAMKVLWDWKERYEHLFSTDVREEFCKKQYTYAEADIEIHRLDRKGNHPKDLGDYDVIALDTFRKRLLIIECKVLQPVGSVFEHSMQQKGFFLQNEYDKKFQKRIDYLRNNYRAFFHNIGHDLGNDEYSVEAYMVTNKIFVSHYKKINFPIVTFDELKQKM